MSPKFHKVLYTVHVNIEEMVKGVSQLQDGVKKLLFDILQHTELS